MDDIPSSNASEFLLVKNLKVPFKYRKVEHLLFKHSGRSEIRFAAFFSPGIKKASMKGKYPGWMLETSGS